MPSFWVLKNNEKKTGVSVFFVDEGIDSGDILVQKSIEIGNRTQAELIKYSKLVGMDAIIEAVNKIYFGNYTLLSNSQEHMTYYSKPTKTDVNSFLQMGKRFF